MRRLAHRTICALLLLALGAAAAVAAPSWGDAHTLRQPDGTQVEVRIWGDEFYRVVESPDGFTLVRDRDTGEICFAQLSRDGLELVSTGYRVDEISGEDLGLERGLRIPAAEARKRSAAVRDEAAAIEAAELALHPQKSTPVPSTLGQVRGLILLIDFDDEAATIPAASVEAYANEIGFSGYNNNGSVRDYFHDVSNGALEYTNFVPAAWHRASQPKSYYDDCDATYATRAREMVREALIALNNAGLDFSQYDANGDGYIDAINCFYAGTTDCGWASGLWPHSGTGLNFSADGVSSYRYQITGTGTNLTLATFCHENGHMLGFWPDLYDYDGSSRGVGRFCLMSATTSATNPQEPSAYMKVLSGWADVVDLGGFRADLPAVAFSNTIYRYSQGYEDYYLLENLQRSGRNIGLPDSGLAIWHCDPTGDNDHEDQTYSLHYEVTLVQADGLWDLENNRDFGDSGDLWSAPHDTEFDPWTVPPAYWWNGADIDLRIEAISSSSDSMSFTFNEGDGLNVPGEFPTVQAAIDGSDGGDIVLADGVHGGPGFCDLDFGGKDIRLRSESGDPTQCILDLDGGPGNECRAIHLHSGEGPSTVIEGVTIRGGWIENGAGGAILLEGASPTIRNVIFQGNRAPRGGALFLDGAEPRIEGCTFHANEADSGQAVFAAGGSNPSLERVLITGSTGTGLPVESDAAAAPDISCSDIHGNANGDWEGALAGLDGLYGNFSLDPEYCDAAAGDLTILENSPCAPSWHPEGSGACGELIGAGPIGCWLTLFAEESTGPVAVGGDTRGVAVADYDGDGDLDLFVVNHGSADVLLQNQGDGTFIDATAAPLGDPGAGTDAAWGDYDNDGDPDLYVGRLYETDLLYRNEGDGTFTLTDFPFMGDDGACMDVSWVDVDGDGLLDIYLVLADEPNVLCTAVGDLGTDLWYFFLSSTGALAVNSMNSHASWNDFDNDGDQDVLIASYTRNSFLVNYGALGFADEGGTSPLTSASPSAGAAWGDYDNDGWLDCYIANDGLPDVLAHNNGGTFTQSSDPAAADAGSGQGALWGDFDNDGLLDLYLARYEQEDRLLWNAGDGVFSSVSVPGGAARSRGAAWADLDGDGDLDLYVGRDGANALLWNQYGQDRHWLHLQLRGTLSNASAIGARAKLYLGGKELMRELQNGSGLLGQGSPRIEFGLGTATQVDSLVIEWPSGARGMYPNPAIDRVLELTEGAAPSGLPEPAPRAVFALRGASPNPFNPATTIRYELPARGPVRLDVYDLRGRLVRTLRSGEVEGAGEHAVVWNGRDGAGRTVASGAYLCRLRAAGREAVLRLALVK